MGSLVNGPPPTDRIEIVCPVCARRLRVAASGKRAVTCPNCGERVAVPDRASPPPAAPVPVPAAAPADDEPTGLPPVTIRPRKVKKKAGPAASPDSPGSTFIAAAPPTEPRRPPTATSPLIVEPDAPPRWTFFSGVFTFPWHHEVVIRWVYLSLGWTSITLIGSIVLAMVASAGGYSGLSLAFFTLPLIWLTWWTLSYSCACASCVIEQTAGGNLRVEEWPEPDWREWGEQLVFFGYVALMAGGAAYAVGFVASEVWGQFALPAVAAFCLLYPLVLLVAFDSENAWIPWSTPILLSLFKSAFAWLTFYLLTGLYWVGFLFLLYKLATFGGGALFWLNGPIVAAVLLTTARLVGRLAWRISDAGPRKRRSRRIVVAASQPE